MQDGSAIPQGGSFANLEVASVEGGKPIVVKSCTSWDKSHLQILAREAKLVGSLNHKNIISLVNSGKDFFTMPY